MTLLERLDGDIHVTSVGNKHVTTMGEYTRDHHTRDTSHYIVGKNEFISSLIHLKVFVVYTNYMYR